MNNVTCELLTLDLWDTVIRRKCHPDAIKESISEFLLINYYERIMPEKRTIRELTQERIQCERHIGEQSKLRDLDDEYEIHDVFSMWLDIVVTDLNDKDKLIEELYLFELDTEIKNAYLDPYIVGVVEKIPHMKLAYVSDFYAKNDFIDSILKAIDCPLYFDEKFISCECGYNKRSGRLYDYVLKKVGICAEQQMHIGDNLYSDVECPKRKNIEAFHFLPQVENTKRVEKEKIYEEEKNEKEINFEQLQAKGNISIFFYGFIRWIMESCIQDNIQKIYFFTREGEFYKRIYEELVKNDCTGKIYPKAELLEVSRLATFCASLREINLTEMMRIWNQYSVQSLAALFKSLGIEQEKVIDITKDYGIPMEEVITYPWQDERVISLFQDKKFLEVMQGEHIKKREVLLEYMSQKGLPATGSGKIAIVDIGWRGTIQDNIGYLLPQYKIKGFYIGLIPFLNEQPCNVYKRGYLNGCDNFNLLLKYVMPFEMICNSPNGSVIGYEWNRERVQAVRKRELEEDRVFYRFIEKIQQSIVVDMREICKNIGEQQHVACRVREKAHLVLRDYILYPQRTVANAYFSLKHNEEFGLGEYVDKTTSFCFKLIINAIRGRKQRSQLAQFLRETTWPQGYLTKYYLKPLVKLYNKRYENS